MNSFKLEFSNLGDLKKLLNQAQADADKLKEDIQAISDFKPKVKATTKE